MPTDLYLDELRTISEIGRPMHAMCVIIATTVAVSEGGRRLTAEMGRMSQYINA
jgi:hypothetical protein